MSFTDTFEGKTQYLLVLDNLKKFLDLGTIPANTTDANNANNRPVNTPTLFVDFVASQIESKVRVTTTGLTIPNLKGIN